jgi:hypothetical protein
MRDTAELLKTIGEFRAADATRDRARAELDMLLLEKLSFIIQSVSGTMEDSISGLVDQIEKHRGAIEAAAKSADENSKSIEHLSRIMGAAGCTIHLRCYYPRKPKKQAERSLYVPRHYMGLSRYLN